MQNASLLRRAAATVLLGWCVSLSASVAPVAPVSLSAALQDAHVLAQTRPGSEVVRVAGESMLPFFGEGSVLVSKPISQERIRPGMILLYTNRDGETVAHRVVGGSVEQGWEVRGFNNDASDTTRVVAQNLRGVVYATFHSNNQVDGLASLVDSTPVALAAPAK